MKWQTNKELDTRIHDISSLIDKNKLIARLSYELNIDTKDLFNYITEEELYNLVGSILINRNIDNKVKIDSVLNNIETSITNPHDLVNAKLSADIITTYLKNPNAIIYVFGDYDCDGVNSLFVLVNVLNQLAQCEVVPILPQRSDGYGLNMKFCEYAINNKNNKDVIVITVDNGITQIEQVKMLKDNGIEVIVTDHHPSKDIVPDCIIVNPHNATIKQDDTFKHLCGCGIAFKVAQLIQENFNVYSMMEYTPNVAIATLSDVMPLNNENMALIQYGLEIINSDKCPKGLQLLKKAIKIDLITSKDILWSIAPMINACGRMGNTALASKLFFVTDTIEEDILEIIRTNDNRKNITKEAKASMNKMNFDNNNVCIIATNEYPGGILGIIAGKATEKFMKPAIVANESIDGLYHGSTRSYNNINMVELFQDMKSKGIIVDYGGHAEACVCTFSYDKIDDMNNYFNSAIIIEESNDNNISNEDILNIDEIITLDHLSKVIYAIVNILPCNGKEYNNPTFALTDLQVVGYSLSKKNPENIKLTIKQGKKRQDIWAWGFGSKYIDELKCPSTIHIAGEITKSFMNDSYTLNVVDIMTA